MARPTSIAERPAPAPVAALRRVGALLQRVPRGGAWLPVLAWYGLIAWLSSWPADPTGRASIWGFWTNLGHAPLYGLLALWMVLLLPRAGGWPLTGRRELVAVLLAVLAAGVADEVHQALGGAGRDFSLLDVVTDLVAAACVLWVVAYLPRREAGAGGLGARLLLGSLACVAAAALATYVPMRFPGIAWM